MDKNFDTWNKRKKNLHLHNRELLFKEGDVWWCCHGLNVGNEIDGKNETYERPVFVLHKCNRHMFIGIPCTNHEFDPQYMHMVRGHNGRNFQLNLSQIKAFSSKRLLRRIMRTHSKNTVTEAFVQYLKRKPAD